MLLLLLSYVQYSVLFRRSFVKELFSDCDELPDSRDLTYYPTVHDVQNHIYQAIRDGLLPTNDVNTMVGNYNSFT